MTLTFATEEFSPDERATLERHFTNLEGPVFALVNLPEAVKGALFARYSRTTKSLRRLFLDEFAEETAALGSAPTATVGSERAARLYENVFVEYGDDSVAQLGGVHLACEQSSQLLAKALEWGRLAAYLEQSTRFRNSGITLRSSISMRSPTSRISARGCTARRINSCSYDCPVA